jgi:VanZ family protein
MKYLFISLASILILIAVLIPGRNIPSVGLAGFDKLVHIGMFASWTLALYYDFRNKSLRYPFVFVIGMLFSLFTEILQVFIEGRTFDWYDLGADAVGIIVGIIMSKPILKLLNKYLP